MDVSENRGTPKLSILIRFSIINHPFWGTLIFGNTHMQGIICLPGAMDPWQCEFHPPQRNIPSQGCEIPALQVVLPLRAQEHLLPKMARFWKAKTPKKYKQLESPRVYDGWMMVEWWFRMVYDGLRWFVSMMVQNALCWIWKGFWFLGFPKTIQPSTPIGFQPISMSQTGGPFLQE